MKTTVQLVDKVPDVNVNVVPCKIQYTGPANTSEFFIPSQRKEQWQGKDVVTATFRGLKLIGEKIELENKVGYLCNSIETSNESPTDPADTQTFREFTAVAKFNEVTVYGHDSCPSENNKWKLLQEWDAISYSINS